MILSKFFVIAWGVLALKVCQTQTSAVSVDNFHHESNLKSPESAGVFG